MLSLSNWAVIVYQLQAGNEISDGNAISPIWTLDGNEIVYCLETDGKYKMMKQSFSGTGIRTWTRQSIQIGGHSRRQKETVRNSLFSRR